MSVIYNIINLKHLYQRTGYIQSVLPTIIPVGIDILIKLLITF